MKIITLLLGAYLIIIPNNESYAQNPSLHKIFDTYYQERLKMFPLEATAIGDSRYNDILPNDGSPEYISQLNLFYEKYLLSLQKFDRLKLIPADRVSYDLLVYTLTIAKEGLKYHLQYMPATQFRSLALTMGTLGSGSTSQPFKTVKDYDNWLKRMAGFKVWVETAISNFNMGVSSGMVLPKAMVLKMIPQMENLAEKDSSKNVFYGPVRKFPPGFTASDKSRLISDYHKAILTELIPSYEKLAAYLKNTYLLHARSTSGYNGFHGGDEIYKYFVRVYTTTNKTPEEIYSTGLREVDRMHKEMEVVKTEVGFKGTLPEFYKYLTTDPKFLPFKTDEEILNAYREVLKKIEPNLQTLFSSKPTTPFEIRQTEAFRAASAAAQYVSGSEDGKRPGIFYVPIVDPKKYPSFSMEDLFLHEAIPGHHYQLSLQSENTTLPVFRRHLTLSAFSEGWGLYAETLGKMLGVYTDPFQYMGSLHNQIHRAIRLVVDVGMHTGKMTREEAIKYMLDNEPVTDQFATSEIERYMATPGQALSYKIGQLKIEELRDRYKNLMANKFNLKYFHDAVLKGGSLPLTVFESYMDDWARLQ